MKRTPLLAIDARAGTVNRHIRKPSGNGMFVERTAIEPEHVNNLGDAVHREGLEAFRQTPNAVPTDDIIEARDEA